MRLRIPAYLPFALCLLLSTANAEIVTTGADRQELSLTIYNSDLALIRDLRRIELPAGEHTLAFQEISAKIQPETALLKGGDVEVIEQNYEFDLLSPETLLRKYVGKEITLIRENIKTGEEYKLDALVLSAADGVVLKVGDHIETGIDGRIVYPDVPENLREKPTLTMLVVGDTHNRDLELSYLSGGLSWKADYVAELNKAEDRVDVKGWVTLTNNSGTDYRNAQLQLIAGDVHRAEPEILMAPMAADMAVTRGAQGRPKMRRESLFEYHLYTVERPTTLLDNQSKQIALLQENDGHCSKELLLLSADQSYYWSKVGEIYRDVAVEVVLHMKNDKASNLGSPKPAGIMRVYKQDSSGFPRFIGEDFIDHTPENELIEIKLGRAFDVTADRTQTDFAIMRGENDQVRIHESAFEITLKNGKDQPVDVTVQENLPGDWEILEESQPHEKESAATVSWNVKVSAKGTATLTYRVRSVMRY